MQAVSQTVHTEHDNRTVANRTRYLEGGTSRADWTRRHQRTNRGRVEQGGNDARREQAKRNQTRTPNGAEQSNEEKAAESTTPQAKNLTKRRRPRDAGHKRTTRAGRPSKPYNAVPTHHLEKDKQKLLAVIPLHPAQNIQTIQRYDRFGDSVQQNATYYCCLGNNADRALHWVATNSLAACF